MDFDRLDDPTVRYKASNFGVGTFERAIKGRNRQLLLQIYKSSTFHTTTLCLFQAC